MPSVDVIQFISGPVIGGIIGYCTNWLAIKMLFRPYNEIKIKGKTLPFTPGIIPRRKDKLARAIGERVHETMFTQEDIEEFFLSENMKQAVCKGFMEILYDEDKNISIGELLNDVIPADSEEDFHKNLDKFMRQEIHRVINRTQIAELVSRETAKIIREKAGSGIASKVLGGGRTTAISDYVGKHMQGFAKEQADTLILRIVREETANAFAKPISNHLEELSISNDQVEEIIRLAYERFMKDYIMDVVKVFDIATLTERKIIEFKAEEIEELVNLTIKTEMQAVVNLGAVIGVVIGFVNSFINTL
ncbi:MAG: DUF445 family protein [Eubacterium sp.]|nr:DUF445 family protein [Eubacterium sp.]